MARFLDTNILVRYLVRDDEEKAMACLSLLERAATGEEKLVTTDLVIAEVVWVLGSSRWYGLARAKIVELLKPIVSLRGLQIPSKGWLPRVLEIYRDTQVDFIDAFNAVFMDRMGVEEIYSYDQDFDGLNFVKRLEP